MRSCDGLVCLSHTSVDTIIWNPLTKWFKTLPTSKIRAECINHKIGFVFDSIFNDYKVFKFANTVVHALTSDHYVPLRYVLRAELYSSNDDSWKEIPVPTIIRSFVPHSEARYVHVKNGAMYLDGTDDLLSFDWRNEVFQLYLFPNFLKYRKSNVLDFEGSVAMIVASVYDRSILSLWMLDDACGGKVSWTKKFNLETDLKIDRIFLYLGVGHFVAESNLRYIFYNHKIKDTKELHSLICSGERYHQTFAKYTESLVSLKGGKKQE